MKEENVPVITDRDELYDKCENMEQLFSNYYLPLLEVHYRKTYDLQRENKSLQTQLKAKEDLIKGAKEYIEYHTTDHIYNGRDLVYADDLLKILKEDNKEK